MAANGQQNPKTNIFANHSAVDDRKYKAEFAGYITHVYNTIGTVPGNEAIEDDLRKMSAYATMAVDKQLANGADEFSFIGVLTHLDENILFPAGFSETPLGLLVYPAHRPLFFGDRTNAIPTFSTTGVNNWARLRAWEGAQFN